MARAGRRRARRLTVEDVLRRMDASSGQGEHRARLERRAQVAAYAQQRAGARIRWGAAAVAGAAVLGSIVLLATMSPSSPPRAAALASVELAPATTPPPATTLSASGPPAPAVTTSATRTAKPTPTTMRPSAAPPPPPPPPVCPAAGTVTLNDNAAGIVYSGSWAVSSGRWEGDFHADVHYTKSNGSWVGYTFTGIGIALVSETFSDEGRMDVYLDDVFQRTVDTTSETRHAQQKVFDACGLTPGRHTLRAVKRSGEYMLVDRLDVTP